MDHHNFHLGYPTEFFFKEKWVRNKTITNNLHSFSIMEGGNREWVTHGVVCNTHNIAPKTLYHLFT